MKKRGLAVFAIPVLGASLLVALTIPRLIIDMPVSNPDPPRTVVIPPRATLREVSGILEKEEVIPHAWLFTFWSKTMGLENFIRYGEYTFSGSLTIRKIMDLLVSGRTTLHPLTVPEGYSLKQIARKIEEQGLGNMEEILAAASDPGIVSGLGVPGDTLEGFCFPDTYLLPRDLPPDKILGRMVSRFWEVFDDNMKNKAGEMGMTILEAVTLASIVEKEACQAAELPLISAVFHNRLERNMRLMADPVVIYGIEDFDGKLRKSDLRRPGPYNVYINRGLPPGPISNPGVASLRAALEPADVDYLFFVSKNNGTHKFSTTLSEHNVAVNTYQRGTN